MMKAADADRDSKVAVRYLSIDKILITTVTGKMNNGKLLPINETPITTHSLLSFSKSWQRVAQEIVQNIISTLAVVARYHEFAIFK